MEQITVKELLQKDIRGKVVCFPTDTVYGVGLYTMMKLQLIKFMK